MKNEFKTFSEFWPFYLSQHVVRGTRICHYCGISLVLAILVIGSAAGKSRLLWLLPLVSYLPAWFGHVVFEKNIPATFKNPIYSLLGDFKMCFNLLSGRSGGNVIEKRQADQLDMISSIQK